MLDITIVAIGQLKEKYFQAAFLEYEKRLRPYVRLKVIELSAQPFFKNEQAKAKEIEGAKILNFLEKRVKGDKPAKIYLLAERGQDFSSSQLAAWFQKNDPLILIIGGALGFSETLYKRYPQISLSPLTFPHELSRVILIEQIYRATTILSNKAYHY
ncbi:MAG: 23S rRNA (pseudouridine(1915)-N(3))-methyltransferase RlmH [Patescibacteria group bacterium]